MGFFTAKNYITGGQATGDRRQGIGERGEGTGERGQATGERGERLRQTVTLPA